MPPRPVFEHLAALTDDRGVFEHARYTAPRPEHGYCVDDAARALVVTARHGAPDPTVRRLQDVSLRFVLAAIADDGRCHNRMDTAGRWTDEPGLGDWWGRALWGLGVAAAELPDPTPREQAVDGFRRLARRRSPDLRGSAFAALGAAALLRVRPGESTARVLLAEFAAGPGRRPPCGPWPWPEPRLSYANAAVAEAVIAAGAAVGDTAAVARGCELLAFLLRTESRVDPGTGHRRLSLTPVGGRGPDDPRPGFDQQPLEAAALAEACVTAHRVTDDPGWLVGVDLAGRWFLGDNDSGVALLDPATGAGFDGLTASGRNLNRGAESTLAALSVVQQAARVAAVRASVPVPEPAARR